jgi:hydrogenase maturation protease
MSAAAVERGSRVVLRPRAGRDAFDLVLAGKVAVVERVEVDMEGNRLVAVVLEDDPGRDLGMEGQPGHRFFFAPEEVEPLPAARVLVAGIGNVFLGDDGFGVELASRLARLALPAGVEVVDFGIRGMDLAYAMVEDYDAVVLLDATPRGGAPGSLYVIEPELDDGDVALDAHGMDPVKVLGLARTLGAPPRRTLVVGCEPQTVLDPTDEELLVELSPPVTAALDEAVTLVESVLEELTNEEARR